jgi:hypothetical protein
MDVKEIEVAVKELKDALERDRLSAIQRSPVYRRDFDNAIGAVETALDHLKHGRTDSLRTLWMKNVALKSIARNYDEFCRVADALE